jgi:hypothetical protein
MLGRVCVCVCVCVCSGNLHFCHSVVQSIYKMGILWQAVFRRETHMVHGSTIWVWSMQIWPPKGLMLQTRLLSSHIALPFLYLKEGKESLRQFSPIHGTLVRTMFFMYSSFVLIPILNFVWVMLQNRYTFEKPVKIYN